MDDSSLVFIHKLLCFTLNVLICSLKTLLICSLKTLMSFIMSFVICTIFLSWRFFSFCGIRFEHRTLASKPSPEMVADCVNEGSVCSLPPLLSE